MILPKAAVIALGGIALYAASPASQIDSSLNAVLAFFDHDEHPDLRGVVVLRDGRVVAERYYNGETPNDLHDCQSAFKKAPLSACKRDPLRRAV